MFLTSPFLHTEALTAFELLSQKPSASGAPGQEPRDVQERTGCGADRPAVPEESRCC